MTSQKGNPSLRGNRECTTGIQAQLNCFGANWAQALWKSYMYGISKGRVAKGPYALPLELSLKICLNIYRVLGGL